MLKSLGVICVFNFPNVFEFLRVEEFGCDLCLYTLVFLMCWSFYIFQSLGVICAFTLLFLMFWIFCFVGFEGIHCFHVLGLIILVFCFHFT